MIGCASHAGDDDMTGVKVIGLPENSRPRACGVDRQRVLWIADYGADHRCGAGVHRFGAESIETDPSSYPGAGGVRAKVYAGEVLARHQPVQLPRDRARDLSWRD